MLFKKMYSQKANGFILTGLPHLHERGGISKFVN